MNCLPSSHSQFFTSRLSQLSLKSNWLLGVCKDLTVRLVHFCYFVYCTEVIFWCDTETLEVEDGLNVRELWPLGF